MASRKPDPYLVDDDNRPLTDEEVKGLRPAPEAFRELGLAPPRPRGRPRLETPKKSITIRLDADIIDHFRTGGRGWQSRLNAALRDIVKKAGQA